MRKSILLLLASLLSISLASAQSITVGGTVLDKSGEPVIGATVLEQGTNNGTTTMLDGTYSIVTKEGAKLMFTCIGYEDVLCDVNGQKVINVTLVESASYLDEVVVVGYGTIRRSTLANSVASVKSDDFLEGAVNSPLQLLQGKVAGLSIGTTSGNPNGNGLQMMLRGVSTLMSNQEPLVVIDGILGASLNNVSPDDVLSVDVLKDGAAAAIYGTQGSNGVILITTKRGTSSNTSVMYHGYASLESISNAIEVFTPEEYRNLEELTDGKFKPLDMGHDTNWGEEVYRPSFSHYHNVSINGGNPDSNWYVNATVNDRNGIMKGTGLAKYSFSAGGNASFFDRKLKISGNLSYMLAKGTKVSEEQAYLGTLTTNPTFPVYNEQTSAYSIFAEVPNPVRSIKEFREDIGWDTMTATGKITYSPIKCLTFNAVGGITAFSHFNGSYATKYFDENQMNGQAWRNTSYNQTNTLDIYGQFNKLFGKHDLVAVAGYSYKSYNAESLNAYNYDFPNDSFEYNNMGLGLALKEGNATMGTGRSMSKLASFFARVNYSYDDRYIAALSVREDGSSKFGPNNRWGTFWSASAAWRISKESFMESADFLDELKLKLSYGVTGVEPTSPYLSQFTYSYGNPTYMNGAYIYTISPTAVDNPNLKWEEKHEFNIGIDFAMFNNRFSGSLDLYNRETRDLLYTYSVPVPPNLASTIYANVGSIANRGIELMLSGVILRNEDWSVSLTGNVSYNENRIVSLSNELFQRDYIETGSTGAPIQKTTHIVKEGGRLGDFYGWNSTGIKKNGAWIIDEGEGKYGDESDRKVIGNGIPKINAGLSANVAWKNLDFSISLRGAFCYQILNQYRMLWETFTKGQQFNYPKTILEKPYGGEAYAANQSYVSYYLEDGDFVKIDNVTLGYNFKFKPECRVKTLRLYVSGLNLYTFTGYKGIDPEVNFGGLSPGIDYTSTYPTTRTVSLGVKFGF